ncbi:hypothetical protein EAI_10944 [Harpegnathos saltator]|uniref:Uncharacterized protein n=1 Tax=Harpegnathos saltator TaxID=610380 RepID=E2B6Q4_HARSA|nr:hypothetical protein EAI_10944 [Harpegnathos saltator]
MPRRRTHPSCGRLRKAATAAAAKPLAQAGRLGGSGGGGDDDDDDDADAGSAVATTTLGTVYQAAERSEAAGVRDKSSSRGRQVGSIATPPLESSFKGNPTGGWLVGGGNAGGGGGYAALMVV